MVYGIVAAVGVLQLVIMFLQWLTYKDPSGP